MERKVSDRRRIESAGRAACCAIAEALVMTASAIAAESLRAVECMGAGDGRA